LVSPANDSAYVTLYETGRFVKDGRHARRWLRGTNANVYAVDRQVGAAPTEVRMKRFIMALFLVTTLVALSGCFFVERDHDGGWHRGRDRQGDRHEERHEERR
jgi:hypothetical protein